MKWAILFIFIVLISCSKKEPDSTQAVEEIEYPDQESFDATMTITNDGRKIGVVRATRLLKYSKKSLTLISEGLKVDFFDNEGNHTSVLNSMGGKVDDRKQDMIAYGNVVVVSDSGMILLTDTLKWDNERQKIISEIPVTIISDTDTLYGDTFISDASLENYEITNSHGSGSEILRKKF